MLNMKLKTKAGIYFNVFAFYKTFCMSYKYVLKMFLFQNVSIN